MPAIKSSCVNAHGPAFDVRSSILKVHLVTVLIRNVLLSHGYLGVLRMGILMDRFPPLPSKSSRSAHPLNIQP